ncbi:hypothetical protein B0H15DRAFT_801033 [Mycena belliarum]|uniref:Uncharacterized protein n=1 Tax=Mycena belliarum TaxID=1033014 RepID=A0AAD6U2C5_9AGAR|nr:hypothetical protein B0H15DRAFT_801033 [Mycena belliae]
MNEAMYDGPSISDWLHHFFPSITNESAAELIAAYPLSDFDSSALQAKHPPAKQSFHRSKAWTYRYSQPDTTLGVVGTGHAVENWMLFQGMHLRFNGSGTFNPLTPVETSLGEELIAHWLSFEHVQACAVAGVGAMNWQ